MVLKVTYPNLLKSGPETSESCGDSVAIPRNTAFCYRTVLASILCVVLRACEPASILDFPERGLRDCPPCDSRQKATLRRPGRPFTSPSDLADSVEGIERWSGNLLCDRLDATLRWERNLRLDRPRLPRLLMRRPVSFANSQTVMTRQQHDENVPFTCIAVLSLILVLPFFPFDIERPSSGATVA